jgi:DsbC/DsbD-like thiol-disulfide interchange protein
MMTMSRRSLFTFAAIGVFALAAAQAPKPKAALAWASAAAAGGSALKGTITLTLPEGHHAYPNPPSKSYNIPVKAASADPAVKLIKASYPKGEMKMAGGEMTSVYEGVVKIPVEVQLPRTKGKKTIKLKVSYQLCTESMCFAPASIEAAQAVTIR